MDSLREHIDRGGCLGIVQTRNGRIIEFHRRGVIDIFELSEREPDVLNGASVADKVIGRGAALLLVRGKVANIYARLISCGAIDVLKHGGITLEYDEVAEVIRNRKGDGQCPVERLTSMTNNPDKAFMLIKSFMERMKAQG